LRDFLTVVAAVIALALLAALAGPHLVDWTAHRAAIAERLERSIGKPVRITGPVSLELLPAPYLKLAGVEIDDEGDGLSARIERLRLRVLLPPLLRGEVRVGEALVQGPVLRVARATRPAGGGGSFGAIDDDLAGRIGIDRLRIERGELVIADGASEGPVAADINGQGEFGTLRGPVRWTGSFVNGGQRWRVRLSTGRVERGETRLRLLVENDLAAMRHEIDGVLSLRPDGDRPAPRFAGTVSANGNLLIGEGSDAGHMLWRASGAVTAAAGRASFDNVEIAAGVSGRQVVLTGIADVTLDQRPKVTATLSTRQIDLDRLLQTEAETGPRVPTPQEALRRLPAGGKPFAAPFDLDLDLSAGNILWGQDRVEAPRARLSLVGGRIGLESLSAGLPGGASIEASGKPGDGDIRFDGQVDAKVRDAERLVRWYTGRAAPGLPFREGTVAGRLRVDGRETAVEAATLRLDQSVLAGHLALVDSGPGGRPRLVLRARSERLDLARLPPLAAEGDTELDLDIDFSAEGVRLNDLGAGRIVLRAERTGNRLNVRELSIRDLGGADVEAAGALAGDAGNFRARVSASRLDALAALARKLQPGAAADALAQRASELSPADLTVTGQSDAVRGQGPRRFTVAGTLGGTRIEATSRLEGAASGIGRGDHAVTLQNPVAGVLLRQIGLDAVPLAEAGPGRLRLELALAQPVHALSFTLEGSLAGMMLNLSGSQAPGENQPLLGKASLRAADLSPLARTLLVTVPVVRQGLALSLTSGLMFENYRITLTDVEARLGDVPVRGEIASNLIEFGRIAGQLRTGVIDIASYLPIVFGDGVAGLAPSGWSREPFPPAASPLLAGDLWLEPEALLVPGGVRIDRPKLVFRFDRGLMFVDHAEGGVGPGRLKLQATLRRAGPQVNVNARMTLSDIPVALLPFAGAIGGTLSGPLELSSLGGSPAELVAGLAGGGRPAAVRISVPRLDPLALARTLARPLPDTGTLDAGELRRVLDSEAAKGALSLTAPALPVVVSSGVVRAGPLSVTLGGRSLDATLAADLRAMTLDARAQYVDRDPPKGWQGAPPQAALLWRGPLANPQRLAEADALLTGLTAMALARDLERIEAFEQDQRERQFYLRRQRASDEERRREEDDRRQAAVRAEQERRDALRRQEEERRRQEDLRRLEAERLRLEAERRRREEEARQEEALRRVRQRIEEERRTREAEEALRRLPLPLAPDLPVVSTE
jgi:hypothetical protein